MANIRVKDLPNTNAANDNDEFIVDSSTSGTRRISYSELKSEISTDFAADVATYGIATLDSDNKLTASQIPDSLAQGMNFVGVANSASDLTSTTQGDFYVIQTAFGSYNVGDQAVYDGSAYVRVVDGTKEISEGGTGATTLDAAKTNLEIINVGTGPSQVPLNQHLGSLAYQSSDGVSVGTLTATGKTTLTNDQDNALVVETENKNPMYVNVVGSAPNYLFDVRDDDTSKFRVDGAGRVGIGVSPSTNLHLYSGSRVDTRIERNSTSAGEIGKLEFSAKDSASNVTSYVLMLANSTVTTNGSEEGKLSVQVAGGSGYGITAAEFTKAGIVMGSGKGIDFGSAATLSDYEEGTHTTTATPSSSGSITLNGTSDTLSYTRVGRKVTVSGALGVSAVSSPVGNYINFTLPLQIADLDELSGHFAGSCVVLNAAGSMGSYSIIGLDGESSFRLYKNTSNSAVATAPDFSGDETIYVSVTYFTTA